MGTATALVVGSPSYPTWIAMVSLFIELSRLVKISQRGRSFVFPRGDHSRSWNRCFVSRQGRGHRFGNPSRRETCAERESHHGAERVGRHEPYKIKPWDR